MPAFPRSTETASSSTTPAAPRCTGRSIDAVESYYRDTNANLGGPFVTSKASDRILEEARSEAAAFLGASPAEIVFGANMTTLTMHASRILCRGLGPGDEILVTGLDHDANVAPWMLAAERPRRHDPPGRHRHRVVPRRRGRLRLQALGPDARGGVRLGLERRRHDQRRRPARRALPRGRRARPTSTPSTTRRTARSTSRRSGATSWCARPTSSSGRTSASSTGAPSCSSSTAPTRCGRRRTSRPTRGRRGRSTSRASPGRPPPSATCAGSGSTGSPPTSAT